MPDNNDDSSLFTEPLIKLGHSLTTPAVPASARQACILTLLRILDNILKDPSQQNTKLRKIKVTNAAFWKRAGRWEGTIDFLTRCGFVGVGKADTSALVAGESNGIKSSNGSVPAQLKLEKENVTILLLGRNGLVKFAVGSFGMDEKKLSDFDSSLISPIKSPNSVVVRDGSNSNRKHATPTTDKPNNRGKPTASPRNGVLSLDKSPSQKLKDASHVVATPKSNEYTSRKGTISNSSATKTKHVANTNANGTEAKMVGTPTTKVRAANVNGTHNNTSKKQVITTKPDGKKRSPLGNQNFAAAGKATTPKVDSSPSNVIGKTAKIVNSTSPETKMNAKSYTPNGQSTDRKKMDTPNNNNRDTSTTKSKPRNLFQEKKPTQQSQPQSPPALASASLSLEQIQSLAQKERDETAVEMRRLNDDKVAAAAEQQQQQARMEEMDKRKRIANERRKKMAEEDRRLESERRELAAAKKMSEGRRGQTTLTSSSTSGPRKPEHVSKDKIKMDCANNDVDAKSLDANALEDEMTDLLDEIESELNDNIFDSSNDDDGANGGDDRQEDGNLIQRQPVTTPIVHVPINSMELTAETEATEDSMRHLQQMIPESSTEGGGQLLSPLIESRVRLEQKPIVEEFGDATASEVSSTQGSVAENGVKPMSSIAALPMQLSEVMEELVLSSEEKLSLSLHNGGDSKNDLSASGSITDNNVNVASNKADDYGQSISVSDLLNDLESENEIKTANNGSCNVHAPTDGHLTLDVQHNNMGTDIYAIENIEHEGKTEIFSSDEVRTKAASKTILKNDVSNYNMDSDLDDIVGPSPPPPQRLEDSYSDLFRNIPLPEGEFSTSDGENEDVIKFRNGFELCHRALFSIWPVSTNGDDSGIVNSHYRRLGSSISLCPDANATTTAGLSKLKRMRQAWEENSEETEGKPVILVPLSFVYTSWARILGLLKSTDTKYSSIGSAPGVQSGMMYSWVVSNHQKLSTFEDDDVSITESLLSNDQEHELPDASIAVCNYVCKELRDLGLLSIYGAHVTMMGEKARDFAFFVGVESAVFEECIQKKVNTASITLEDESLLADCHGILARRVYPRILGELSNDAPERCNNQVLMWYSGQHAIRHLLMASESFEDAKSMLLNSNFIRLRLQSMGLLLGTSAHCRDCAKMDAHMAQSVDEWRRKQLQAADVKREQLSTTSSLDEYETLGSVSGTSASTRPPNIAQWKEEYFKMLTSISTILREKAVEVAASSPSRRRCQLQKDIGDALQMIGESIGDNIGGVYHVQEMEHYEEALQLKSEGFGDDQNHPTIADILYIMGCHHQRFHHFKFAQKYYEQALRIFKVTLGYEHLCVARVLHNIGIMYHAKKDNTVALKCLKKSLSIRTLQLGESPDLSVADSYCWIGKIRREKKHYAEARECFMKAHQIKVEVLGKAHIESAEVLHNVGIVCDDLGFLSQSLSCFREALLIRLANVSGAYDINGINDVCETLDCIANVYRIKGELQKALQFFEQCLKRRVRLVSSAALSDKSQVSLLLRTYEDVLALTKLQAKESEDKSEMSHKIGTLLVEMGTLYDHRLNKQSKALIYLQKALQVFQQKKYYEQIGNTLSLIGVIHVKKSANEKAIKCFRDSLVMRKIVSSKQKETETAGMAETLHNIGNCEAREGHFENSLSSYSEALQIKKKIFPEEHISIAKTEHCMGLALLQLGNLDDALENFERSGNVRRKFLGSDHLDVAFSLHSLGRIYFHKGKIDHATTCLEEALEIKKSKLSEDHFSLAETEHLLGSLYIKKSKFAPAIPLLKSALIAYKGSRDCEIMKSDVLDLLGSAYSELGENDHGILSYEHSLKIKKVVVGKNHVACANVQMEIGKLKSLKNDIDGALVAFKEVKRIQKITYGKNHLRNADLLIQVGLVQDRLNNHEMALRCFVEALRMRRKLLDKNHRDIAEALCHTGRMHQSKDDHFKAISHFQEAIDLYHISDGVVPSQECANACRLIGLSQIAGGDNENALSSLETCLEVREATYGCESQQWAEVAYDLGIAKCDAGFYDDAITLLNKFVILQKSIETSDSEGLSTALFQLGKIYIKKRSIDNAMTHFDEALGIRKQSKDNELGVSEVLFQIGGVRESRKQYLESLVCYEESLKLRLSVSGEDEETADIISRIGEVRRIRGQYDLALENFGLALDMYKRTVGETHLSVADTYHSLGYVCDAKSDIQKAMQNHKEGLSVRKLMLGGDHVKVAASLDDIAGMYQKQNEQKKALKCLKEALRIRRLQLGNDDIEIGKTLFGMGIIFAAFNDNEKATECYNASWEISSRDGGNPKLEAQTLHQIGCLNAANCNYREALQNWRTCLSKYRESGLPDDHYMVACTLGNIEMAENVLNSA